MGMRIVSQVKDQLSPTHIDHRPDGYEGAESDHFTEAPVENGRAHGAALTDEAYVAWMGHCVGKCRVQPVRRAHYAQAVWADDSHARASLRLLEDLTFEGDALRASELSETGGNDHAALDACVRALADDTGHRPGRRDDHR